MLDIIILVFIFLSCGFYFAYGNSWVEVTYLDGTKIRQETEHSNYTTFNILFHNGESRGNVPHALCIHDWNGSIAGFRHTKDTYQDLVNQINAKFPLSIIEWVCHEGSVNGWNDLYLDPANIIRLESWWGDVIDIKHNGSRLTLIPHRR